jgi:hypothetical protein
MASFLRGSTRRKPAEAPIGLGGAATERGERREMGPRTGRLDLLPREIAKLGKREKGERP